MSANEESSLPMQDKQETTCESQKCKETELELSWNKMVKQKVYRAKVIPKKKWEDLLKSFGSVKLNIFQIEYIRILQYYYNDEDSPLTHRKGFKRQVDNWQSLLLEYWSEYQLNYEHPATLWKGDLSWLKVYEGSLSYAEKKLYDFTQLFYIIISIAQLLLVAIGLLCKYIQLKPRAGQYSLWAKIL